MANIRRATIDPVIFPPSVWFARSISGIAGFGCVTRDIEQICVVFQFPGARQPEDVAPWSFVDELERLFGGKSGIGFDNYLLRPARRDKTFEHFLEASILMSFDLGVDDCGGDRNSK